MIVKASLPKTSPALTLDLRSVINKKKSRSFQVIKVVQLKISFLCDKTSRQMIIEATVSIGPNTYW